MEEKPYSCRAHNDFLIPASCFQCRLCRRPPGFILLFFLLLLSFLCDSHCDAILSFPSPFSRRYLRHRQTSSYRTISGFLSSASLSHCISCLQKLDSDDNGYIDREEFSHFFPLYQKNGDDSFFFGLRMRTAVAPVKIPPADVQDAFRSLVSEGVYCMHFSGSYCLGIVVEDEALARSNSQLDYNFGTCGLLDRVVRRAAEAAEAAAAEAAAAEAVAAAAAALEEKKKEQQKAKNSSAFSSFSEVSIALSVRAQYEYYPYYTSTNENQSSLLADYQEVGLTVLNAVETTVEERWGRRPRSLKTDGNGDRRKITEEEEAHIIYNRGGGTISNVIELDDKSELYTESNFVGNKTNVTILPLFSGCAVYTLTFDFNSTKSIGETQKEVNIYLRNKDILYDSISSRMAIKINYLNIGQPLLDGSNPSTLTNTGDLIVGIGDDGENREDVVAMITSLTVCMIIIGVVTTKFRGVCKYKNKNRKVDNFFNKATKKKGPLGENKNISKDPNHKDENDETSWSIKAMSPGSTKTSSELLSNSPPKLAKTFTEECRSNVEGQRSNLLLSNDGNSCSKTKRHAIDKNKEAFQQSHELPILSMEELNAAINAGDWNADNDNPSDILTTTTPSNGSDSSEKSPSTLGSVSCSSQRIWNEGEESIEVGDWSGTISILRSPSPITDLLLDSISSSSSEGEKNTNNLQPVIKELIRRAKPEEVCNFDKIMKQFLGREEELVKTLVLMLQANYRNK